MTVKLFSVSKLLGVLLLASLCAWVSVPPLRAEDDCQKRVIKADRKLHEEAAKHGWESPQAEHWRHELADARAYCWHDQRDWDDHDHDHH